MDVEELFPSIDQQESARLVAKEIVGTKSGTRMQILSWLVTTLIPVWIRRDRRWKE